MSGLLEVFILAATMLAVGVWVATVFVARAPEQGRSPRSRETHLRAWLYAPLWVPVVLLASAQLPGLWGRVSGEGDHCLADGGLHHHLCVFHPPHLSNEALPRLAAVGLWGLVLLAVGVLAWRLAVARRLSNTLVRSAQVSSLGDDVGILEQDEPIALSLGTLRPRILLSTGLLQRVSERTLRVVLAHERAHVLRRDLLWAQLDRLVAALLPAAVRDELLGALSLAREQACDTAAADTEGRVHVAAALTEIARLGVGTAPAGLSIAASSLEARILHLLDGPRDARTGVMSVLATVVAAVCIGAGPVHALLEHLLAPLLH